MSESIDRRLRELISHAHAHSSAFRRRLEQAGLEPGDVAGVDDLSRVPILPKDDVVALQQADPPFGGMLAVPLQQVRRIFFSPGPIYEPDISDFAAGVPAVQECLRQSGFVPGDIVLNTLSYHLVPAGLILDFSLADMGCTVIPGGTGPAELQLQMMRDLGATGYSGTASFLLSLIQKAEGLGLDFRRDFELSKALVTAEPLPGSLRQTLVDTYGLSVGNAYATAELGFLAINTDGSLLMRLMSEPIVQVVDPDTGQSVGPGEAGEVVVTTFEPGYPLIRFGTGDLAVNVDPAPGRSRQEERAIILVGRRGEAVKVRGMFVHPNQLRFAVAQLVNASAVQGVVSRPETRDHLLVRILLDDMDAADPGLVEPIKEAIRQACRVRVDAIEFVPAADLPAEARGMVDERSWD